VAELPGHDEVLSGWRVITGIVFVVKLFVKIPPGLATATNLIPSDDEATDHQYAAGALVCVQLAPESVEL